MSFQPIVDVERREVFAYEALVRGVHGESAGQALASVGPEQLYSFDQTCRVLAIETAQRLSMPCRLSINFLPNAVYDPATCIRLTLAAAQKVGFSPQRLIFEMTEVEKIRDQQHALSSVRDSGLRDRVPRAGGAASAELGGPGRAGGQGSDGGGVSARLDRRR
ncbi:MAG: EAL domain-containing protein [Tepidimonas taiwanensis]|nr:EAL domain-containing protein [Tepidimonas taiwanensis]MDM7462829.1 EAL domain-containing protein [Tepidimonas taiwanensis]